MALDELSRELAVPVTTIQWVTTAYVLAMTAVIPLVGWSVGRFGARTMWLVTLSLFLLGSVLSGLAWSAGSLSHRPDLPAVRSRASAPGDRSPHDDRKDPADPMNTRTAPQAAAPNLVPLAATLLAGAIAALLDSTITTMALDELSRELAVPVT